MSDQSLWYLENIDLTGIFCPNKTGELIKTHKPKIYKTGEYIYLPNDSSDSLFLVSRGQVKIGTHSETGKEITKAILGVGEVFGEMALIGEQTRRDFAISMEDTELCQIQASKMESLLKEHNALSLFIMKVMGSRTLKMEQRLESLVFKDSRTRIIDFLREMADHKGIKIGYEVEVKKFLTHQEIANMTATSRQTVTTLLNELRTNNIISFNRKRLLIRDMEKLK